MLRSRTLWPTLALAALLVACAPQDTAEVEEYQATEYMDMEALGEAMNTLEADYIAAYNAGDAAGIAALFAADAMQSPPLSAPLDVAGIEAAYAAMFAEGPGFMLEVMREDFVVSGDVVVAWGTFAVTATPEGAEPIMANGRYGSVVHKQADGSWKIFRHMFNYEVPPPGFGM